MHNNHLSFLFHLSYLSTQQKWIPNICECFIHQNMFKGQDAFIFYGHIVNDHTSMKDVNHNAPIPLFTQFLDYAKKWLQHAKSSFNIFLNCFLLSCKLFFFLLLSSWRVCIKIDYIRWYYWLAISNQSSSCNDVHSLQSSCYFLHLVTKRNLCNTLMSMLSLGVPKEQCQIQKLWSQMTSEIVAQFLFLLVSCQKTRQNFQQLCMWSKEVNMPSST